MEERWLPCVDKDVSNYEISDLGRIRNPKTGRILKPYINHNGYEIVCLTNCGRQYVKKVHLLVAITFLGDRPPGLEAYHLDGNKRNNRADNLAWGTRSEIIKLAYETGNITANGQKRILLVETGEVFNSIGECSRVTGISRPAISRSLNRRSLGTSGGYHFEHIE